ncbi:MAG: hypothetical protein EHM23_00195 [Acidobacteria bacterium]|nr:MAG: hypothetical protein EHM23_35190 [Acidobacteriota bacterium]RPJ56686.1 MAG: hypothetical protein EHM23_22840 [Acidobacteriota bacterium]RPJ64606.1 MAG: hypothetical protein EHM23_00195 [Acidobacteriota bacterium]
MANRPGEKRTGGRTRLREGDVFAISLGEDLYGYCRYLTGLLTEFFDIRSSGLSPVEEVVSANVVFTVWVSKEAFKSDKWNRIGSREVRVKPNPVFFKQDPITNELCLYQDYRETPATLAECQGLERAAVWSANHIEDRLRDHFEGRPNRWVESLKPKGMVQ